MGYSEVNQQKLQQPGSVCGVYPDNIEAAATEDLLCLQMEIGRHGDHAAADLAAARVSRILGARQGRAEMGVYA
jgi:hypothetical protein